MAKTDDGRQLTELEVKYRVEFNATLKLDPDDDVGDVISNIDIPEGLEGQYVSGSFEIERLNGVTEDGQLVEGLDF